jgi:phosphopantetheinyl transferase (holo-ACP synthase)
MCCGCDQPQEKADEEGAGGVEEAEEDENKEEVAKRWTLYLSIAKPLSKLARSNQENEEGEIRRNCSGKVVIYLSVCISLSLSLSLSFFLSLSLSHTHTHIRTNAHTLLIHFALPERVSDD